MTFGAGGAIGRAVARRFAAEGAVVHLRGRTLAGVDTVAKDIDTADGVGPHRPGRRVRRGGGDRLRPSRGC